MNPTNAAGSQHEFALARTTARNSDRHNSARDARIKTACAECKRRKTKCDGTNPCYSCRWYKQPERCIYTFSRPALVLSRKNFDSVRERLETTTDILSKLFPVPSIEHLGNLSREELLARLGSASFSAAQGDPPGETLSLDDPRTSIPDAATLARNDSADRLDDSEDELPEPEKDDASSSDPGDDVNALSARPNQSGSYVGPSSTMQMFRTILRIAPESSDHEQTSLSPKTTPHRSGSVRSPANGNKISASPQITDRLRSLIDSYFSWIHPATPVVHEEDFRNTAYSETRNDAPWLCLFNMVLALGSIGLTTTDSKEHLTFYNAAKMHLDLEGLGNKSFETLQALILMAGWYNHYRNRPDLASALLGAAFRMAYALGLHKESPNNIHQSPEACDLRRKIWWNLVVFDAAEAVTLGRTLDSKIFETEVHFPGHTQQHDFQGLPSTSSMLNITIGFSRIMTEIQSRLMTATALPFTESLSLDAHLVDWYEALPAFFHDRVCGDSNSLEAPLLKRLAQPCATIKWRYLNLRMLLYRPSLMEAVLHRIPFRELSSDQRLCVRKCLTLSGELIESVKRGSSAPANQYIAWPSTWYLLQTCMVPLLSLYVFREDTPPNSRHLHVQPGFNYSGNAHDQVQQVREECHRQVQSTLQLMKEMQPWAIASDKMHNLINHLYQARRQNLRVWNNTEESPVLVLGSPATSSTPVQQSSSSRWKAPQRQAAVNKGTDVLLPQTHLLAPPSSDVSMSMSATNMPQYGGIMQQMALPQQFDQFSRDWSMYNSFAWPNANLESLFDLPDDFNYVSQDNFNAQ